MAMLPNVASRATKASLENTTTLKRGGCTLSQFWSRIRSPEYSEPRTSTQSFIVNQQGLFNWNRWDGLLWQPEEVPAFALKKSFLVARRTEPLLSLAERRSGPLDTFWITHYRTVLAINKSMENLELHALDISCIIFVLNTAPKSISGRLFESLQNLGRTNYHLDLDLLALRDIRKIVYRLENNPLYSSAQTKKHLIRAKIWELKRAKLLNNKIVRMDVKETSKIDRTDPGGIGDYDYDRYQASSSRVRSWAFRREKEKAAKSLQKVFNSWPDLWGIEPFTTKMSVYLAGAIMAIQSVSHGDSIFYRVYRSRSVFYVTQNTIYWMHVNIRAVYELCDDLAALRYYKLKSFPGSISKKEVELGKLLWNQITMAHNQNVLKTRSRQPVLKINYHQTPVLRIKYHQTIPKKSHQTRLEGAKLRGTKSSKLEQEGLRHVKHYW